MPHALRRPAAMTAACTLAMVPARAAAETAAPATQASIQTPSGQPVNAEAALAADFTRRVQEYMEVHKKAASKIKGLSREATPQEIDEHQRALAREIQNLRRGAKVADVFTRELRAYFRRQMAAAFSGPEGTRLKASIMDENPGPIKLQPNGRYPDTVPLATMPPQVLAALPKLPQQLEYRFIGSRLILLDVPSHLVVDYIDDALPR